MKTNLCYSLFVIGDAFLSFSLPLSRSLFVALLPSGHPFPLKGRFQALIFIHFEPTGHPLGKDESGYYYLRHEHEEEEDGDDSFSDDEDEDDGEDDSRKKKLSKSDRSKREKDADNQYHEATKKGIGGQSSGIDASNHLPPYIKRESPEEEHWLEQHPDGWEPVSLLLCLQYY